MRYPSPYPPPPPPPHRKCSQKAHSLPYLTMRHSTLGPPTVAPYRTGSEQRIKAHNTGNIATYLFFVVFCRTHKEKAHTISFKHTHFHSHVWQAKLSVQFSRREPHTQIVCSGKLRSAPLSAQQFAPLTMREHRRGRSQCQQDDKGEENAFTNEQHSPTACDDREGRAVFLSAASALPQTTRSDPLDSSSTDKPIL